MTNYTNYEYYFTAYRGTKFNNIDVFNYFCRLASIKLKNLTMNRITELTDDVQDCTCAIMDYLIEQDSADNGGVASESLANHSISYRGRDTELVSRERIASIARDYLGYTGLLYSGTTK